MQNEDRMMKMKERLINEDLNDMNEVSTMYSENCNVLRPLTVDQIETVDDFIKELKAKRKN